MVTKISAPGRSFGGVAGYCLHDRWVPGRGHPESAERVEWTETRNLATEHEERQGGGVEPEPAAPLEVGGKV